MIKIFKERHKSEHLYKNHLLLKSCLDHTHLKLKSLIQVYISKTMKIWWLFKMTVMSKFTMFKDMQPSVLWFLSLMLMLSPKMQTIFKLLRFMIKLIELSLFRMNKLFQQLSHQHIMTLKSFHQFGHQKL